MYTHTEKIAMGACKAVNFVSDAEQHGSHVEYEVLTVVSASSPEEATSKAERKRILGASYSNRKDT